MLASSVCLDCLNLIHGYVLKTKARLVERSRPILRGGSAGSVSKLVNAMRTGLSSHCPRLCEGNALI
jgi:hypothetical protein